MTLIRQVSKQKRNYSEVHKESTVVQARVFLWSVALSLCRFDSCTSFSSYGELIVNYTMPKYERRNNYGKKHGNKNSQRNRSHS